MTEKAESYDYDDELLALPWRAVEDPDRPGHWWVVAEGEAEGDMLEIVATANACGSRDTEGLARWIAMQHNLLLTKANENQCDHCHHEKHGRKRCSFRDGFMQCACSGAKPV